MATIMKGVCTSVLTEKYEEKALLQYLNNLLQDKKIYRYLGSAFWEWVMENLLLFGLGEEAEVEEIQTLTRRRGVDSGNRALLQQEAGAAHLRPATGKRLKGMRAPRRSNLENTIQAVASLFQLNQDEKELFGLLVRIKKYGYLKEMMNVLSGSRHNCFSSLEFMDVCCRLTGMSGEAIAAAIRPMGRLMNCGMIDFERYSERLEISGLMSHVINQSKQLQSPNEVKVFLSGAVQQASLKWEEFSHLGQDRELLAKIVGKASCNREIGINVLFYGKPGTGKTEFCKTLADRLGLSLYAVMEADSNNGEPTREERLKSLRMLQTLIAGEPGNCIILDEAEDVFGSGRNIKQQSKAYMNRLLEENPVPVFWLTNNTENIDPAYIRRMTYCLEFSGLPEDIRVQMAVSECEKQRIGVSKEVIANITTEFQPSPALFSSAVRATRLADGGEAEIRNVIEHMDKLMGGKRLEGQYSQEFSLELLNTDVDLAKIAETIKQKKKMDFSFCLYGPSGTGKSEYARWLAAQLGLPVLFKRASDLNSKWVGETEKNIAAAFKEAQENKRMLVFDEADSLLRSRRAARTSWEVSQVNEMLTWMERHPYPFICTTNFREQLDEAAFRRFTFKVQFAFLSKSQIQAAFQMFFDISAPSEALGMSTLTPSDFAVVKKKLEYMEAADAKEIIKLLRNETSVKTASVLRNAIGFLT